MDIEERRVVAGLFGLSKSVGSGSGAVYQVPLVTLHVREGFPDIRIVIDNKNRRGHGATAPACEMSSRFDVSAIPMPPAGRASVRLQRGNLLIL